MNKKNKGVFFAIVFAVLGIVFISLYIKKVEQKYIVEEKTLDILVAKQDIASRQILKPEFLVIKKIPKSFVQPGALKSDTQLLGEKGRPIYATLLPIKKGEQILFTKISRFGKKTGLSLTIPDGYRAVSVTVNKNEGVGELIKPGDYVDVFLLIEYNVEEKKKSGFGMSEKHYKSMPLFQNVYVLAVNDELTVEEAKVSAERGTQPQGYLRGYTVTLAFKPEDVPKFIYARDKAKITLVLRPMGDKEIKEIKEVELKDIVKEGPKKKVTPPEEGQRQPGISIIKGLQEQIQKGKIIPFPGQ